MRKISLFIFSIFLAAGLFACGRGHDTGLGAAGQAADPNAPATIALSASKDKALANGSDVVTMKADVRKASGAAVADGTLVTFTAQDGCTLSAPQSATVSGLAIVTVARSPITDAKAKSVPVTGSAGGISDSKSVKFINPPAEATVLISFKQEVTNLAALSLRLNNTSGASFNNSTQRIVPANAAVGSLLVGNFNSAANSNTIGLVSGLQDGFKTGTTPVIQATYAITPDAALPVFSIDTALDAFSATNGAGDATTPAVSAADLIVSVTFDTEM